MEGQRARDGVTVASATGEVRSLTQTEGLVLLVRERGQDRWVGCDPVMGDLRQLAGW